MEFKTFTIKELYKFINSDEAKNQKDLPISTHRCISYMQNPNISENDIVACCVFEKNQLIAYRTILADSITIDEIKEKFFWLSGSWVRKDYQGKNLSLATLKQLYQIHGNKLAACNMTKISEAIVKKSNFFPYIFNIQGFRYYHKSQFRKIIPKRYSKSKFLIPIFFLIDIFLNFFLWIHSKFTKYKSELKTIKISEIDSECLTMLSENYHFENSEKYFKWLKKYPWIVEKNKNEKQNYKYYFSSNAKEFKQYFLKFYDENNFLGFAMISIRDGFAKIPYFYVKKNSENLIVKAILYNLEKEKIHTLTVFNQLIISEMEKTKKYYFYKKAQYSSLYFSFSKIKDFSKNIDWQDGIGDKVFT